MKNCVKYLLLSWIVLLVGCVGTTKHGRDDTDFVSVTSGCSSAVYAWFAGELCTCKGATSGDLEDLNIAFNSVQKKCTGQYKGEDLEQAQ